MNIKIEARAESRALVGGLVMGAAFGLLLGGAYLAVGRQTAMVANARHTGFSQAIASEQGLRAELGVETPGEWAAAQRRDPFADINLRGPEPALGGDARMLRASLGSVPSARPFRFATGGAQASTRDLDCLTDAVYYEARGETSSGQAAVAQVVLNRVRHPSFPKSVCGVVFQGARSGDTCQFSFACNGSMDRPRDPDAWRRAGKVAARALEGFVMPSVGNATHFHVAGLRPDWGPSLLRVAQVGLHVFYRFGGYAGAAANFNARPERSDNAAPPAPRAVYASLAPLTGVAAPAAAPIQGEAANSATPPVAQPSPAKPVNGATVEAAQKSEPTGPSKPDVAVRAEVVAATAS